MLNPLHFDYKGFPHTFIPWQKEYKFGKACCCWWWCCVQSRKLQFSAPSSKFGKVHASQFLYLKCLLYILQIIQHWLMGWQIFLCCCHKVNDDVITLGSYDHFKRLDRQVWANGKKVTGQLAIFKLYFSSLGKWGKGHRSTGNFQTVFPEWDASSQWSDDTTLQKGSSIRGRMMIDGGSANVSIYRFLIYKKAKKVQKNTLKSTKKSAAKKYNKAKVQRSVGGWWSKEGVLMSVCSLNYRFLIQKSPKSTKKKHNKKVQRKSTTKQKCSDQWADDDRGGECATKRGREMWGIFKGDCNKDGNTD